MTLAVPDSDEAPYRPRNPLTRPWVMRKLMRELAIGEKTQAVLAEEYGVSQPAISIFGSRHREAIEAIRTRMDDEFAGLWIANKANRLIAYQSDVEMIEDLNAKTPDSEWTRIRHRALRNVAEEMGHLPPRVAIVNNNQARIDYHVSGINLEALK